MTLNTENPTASKSKIDSPAPLTVAVMITTHNRMEILRETCKVLEELYPPIDQVLICADGCTDGTVEMMQTQFPHYQLWVNQPGKGSVASRDRLMRKATTDLVLALDDDSYPLQSDIVERVQSLFATRPRLAVVSFPQRTEEYPDSLTADSFGNSFFCGSFASAAACFRRSIYQQVDGFFTQFFHMYEEPDYALQCLAAGYEVWHETSIEIRHLWTGVSRNEIRNHHRHARNEQWSLWRRCPFPYVLLLSPYRLVRQWQYAASRGWRWIVREPLWWWAMMQSLPEVLGDRDPIPWSTYRAWIGLLSQPIYSEQEWQATFSKSSKAD
ncbi:glycosyltransferase family 2 protein [Vacuolonema iberomarrocanum]|uniref:glycosyltransferase family 2 protein n=1 Tax=Vacuolonema iberomarrocanum TaxID=3454632 RepID=UPI0019E0BC35|nr:glycosyltransferase family 2 protein [filamentous cyanobacterium LEGE 07170]